MEHVSIDVVVVGAGMAGLMAANLLQKNGLSVTTLDKGRGVGGRLGTRHIGPGRADHGAQFFTVRTPAFQHWVDQWQYEKRVYLWSMGWSDGSLEKPGEDGHPRYAVHGGMNALAQHLAQDLDDVRTGVQVVTVTPADRRWLLQDAEGQVYESRALVMTPPVPHSLDVLHSGATHLSASDQAALERIQYGPCLAGLFWVDGTVNLPEPGAVQRPGSQISWIADNHRKGISPEATILTVHASPEYSQQLWAVPDDQVLETLRASLKPYLDSQSRIREAQLKRWRYSIPLVLHSELHLMAEGLPPLVFAGDAFSAPRVEGAALSGLSAGRVLADQLQVK